MFFQVRIDIKHTSLKYLDISDINNELIESKEVISGYLNDECKYFAFPFGSKLDFNIKTIELVKKSNYQFCFLNIQGFNIINSKLFTIKRIFMSEYRKFENFLY